MTIVLAHTVQAKTPYPFNRSRRDYDLAVQRIPLADLRAEIETAQELALDVAGVPGDSRGVAELQLEGLVAELERRRRLYAVRAADPLRPAWPRRDTDLKARVETVKAAWPIERFCVDVLGIPLKQYGRDSFVGSCPLPGHDDRSPSFHVTPSKGLAFCFSCNRGGDVIKLTGYVLGLERFYDRLEHLERLAGIVNQDVA